MTDEFHQPVMVQEIASHMLWAPRRIIADCTVGDGGHSFEFLTRAEDSFVVGMDVDGEAVAVARSRLSEVFSGRFVVVKGDYRELPAVLARLGIPAIDGALFDLGVSTRQLSETERGFSYWGQGPLDMRMNRENGLTAGDIVMNWSEEDLERILREYGEERFSARIARQIVRSREETLLSTSQDLVDVIKRAVPGHKWGGTHPARRTFQALRIMLNDELSRLGASVASATHLLRPGGVVAVLSYHSLEDRIVKNTMKSLEDSGIARRLLKKPAMASEVEVLNNARSRSAKLRLLQKL